MRIIAGRWKGLSLQYPNIPLTRPTSDRLRETMFNVLTSYFLKHERIFSKTRVADLFAGSGALGLEALSRGAQHATFFEQNPQAGRVLQENILKLQAHSQSCLVQADVFSTPRPSELYDLIFADPPYHQGLVIQTLSFLEQQNWVNTNGMVVAETSSTEPLTFSKAWQLEDHRTSGNSSLWILKYKSF